MARLLVPGKGFETFDRVLCAVNQKNLLLSLEFFKRGLNRGLTAWDNHCRNRGRLSRVPKTPF